MSRTQRLSFLGLAAVLAVAAVVIIVLASGGSGASSENAATTNGVPTLTQGKVTKLKYTQGDTVRFKVRTDNADEVHVHGYNIERETKANTPLTLSFKATINGIFEIELHHADVQIGQLTVEPR